MKRLGHSTIAVSRLTLGHLFLALIGALDALDDVGQASLGDLAARALLSGPGPERGSHAVGGAVDAEFSHQLRERLVGQRPTGSRGRAHQPVAVAETAGVS